MAKHDFKQARILSGNIRYSLKRDIRSLNCTASFKAMKIIVTALKQQKLFTKHPEKGKEG